MIRILPQALANKIAAGEVVQRPASAVKELLENAIDAHAGSITVSVREGGTSFIRVIDDGEGMSPEDAALAFERHATSKIATYEDLECIRTLGFRGEALASIAAVAHVELLTRRAADDVATAVRIDGEGAPKITREAGPPGTSVSVRRLFYNTPGRRNFLKSTRTEFRHISDAVQRVAIAHPGLRLRFVSDDETLLNLQPAAPIGRIRDLFGKLADTVFEFSASSPAGTLTGFLGKPLYARKSRMEQYLFLNRRYVVSRSITHAVAQAYEHLLEKGSFPFFVLFLDIDPHRVDVNVHPSKLEVKFEEEQAVYRFVFSAVRRALSEHDLVPALSASTAADAAGIRFRQEPAPTGIRPAPTEPFLARADEDGRVPASVGAEPALPVWQVHNKYLVVTTAEGLMLVDQHAAHERVLYERTVARFANAGARSQQLLFPHTVDMTPGDAALVQQLLPDLEGIGFSLKLFGPTTVIIDGVPADVKPREEASILRDVLDLYKRDPDDLTLEPRIRLAKSLSCKAAVKAGDPLSAAEMRSLLDQLFKTEVPFVCPHGRPVIIKIALGELDRRFGRPS